MNYHAKSPTLGLRPEFTTAPGSLEAVLAESLRLIESLVARARARIAAYDADRVPEPLPSLTSAFATRREIFGPVTVEVEHG